ncbi:MAG TPA: type II 3-dehydroquinate dehydratase [Solirubrobacteraceae bacterium]|jgi:3-dehydroquinate dehydratase-2|nr:type II 3-dehydroquinate dehydratase [Solirubrobacteraceae bacterium]
MSPVRNRVTVMHGVNLDMLGRRDPAHYGTLTLAELEHRVTSFGRELELEVSCFQTNSEVEFITRLHQLPARADGVLLNPGAWTHYAWSIHDALEIAGLPAVEVHLSNIDERESWRSVSVVRDLVLACVSGQGVEGYREALVRLSKELDG